ncbi:MAG: class I SAM-dependent methyltransferase [Rubrobacteraceae bacterium]
MGKERNDLAEQNRRSWNAVVGAHESHRTNLAPFLRNGGSALFPEELELLGDLNDRTVTHLMCNTGADSLSLAALGAKVVGVDISNAAIHRARKLSDESGISAHFERSEIYGWLEKAGREDRRFDLAFASYGVVCWLRDLDLWADGVASILKPGGRFVLVDFHPFSAMFDGEWKLTRDYRSSGSERDENGVGDYVGDSEGGLAPSGFVEGVRDYQNPEECHLFRRGIGEVVTALAGAGLKIEALKEYPYSNGERPFSGMRELAGRRMFPPEGIPALPLMYGLSAKKLERRATRHKRVRFPIR